jgi:hypothetical protein
VPPADSKRHAGWDGDISSPAPSDFKQTQIECDKSLPAPARVLISDITADATGEFFLYVNDAVLIGRTRLFYLNNGGTAKSLFPEFSRRQ